MLSRRKFFPPQSSVKQVAQSIAEDVVTADKGWGKVVLGTPKSEIEKLLGVPDFKADYLSFYGKSGIYVYYSRELVAREISFEISIGKSQSNFQGKPDKTLKWGAISAQVIKVYGTPVKRRLKDAEYQGAILKSIIYNDAEFILQMIS